MKTYLQHFAFKTVDSQQFKDFFTDYFKDKAEGALGAGEGVRVLLLALTFCSRTC
jgi:hypothetical protein